MRFKIATIRTPSGKTRQVVLEKKVAVDGIVEEVDPTVPAWAKQPDPPTYTAADVGALPADTPIPENTSDLTNDSGYITIAVATLLNYYLKTEVYNRSEAYSRTEVDNLISGLDKRLNAIADSTDVDLDQLSEIVAYIKSNKSLIDSITTSKVNVSDIVDNLTTGDSKKPLSAAQGKVLKGLYDALPAWAKAANKPTYSKSEVGLGNVDNVRQYSESNPPPYPVTSVNGKTGAVSLGASDVGARPDTWTPTAADVGALPSGTKIPAKTSDITNDSGFITKAVADLTNYYTKSQTYTQAEVNALVSAIPKFAISVVSALPTSGISTTTVYLVKSGTDGDLYTEYIYVGGAWEILGSQRVDLTGYATEAWVNTKIADFLTADKLTAAIVTGALGFTPAKAADIPAVDSTLKVSGAAADAAVVGGKFTEVSKAIADKLPKNQGAANVGKILVVGADGNLTLTDMPEGGASGDVTGVLDDSKNILLTGNLADGTYTLKWKVVDENGEASYVDAGALEVSSIVTYTVTQNLTEVTSDYSVTEVRKGESVTVNLTANDGYNLKSITVTMGGTDITSTAVSDSKVTIASVTGDVVITAVAEEIKVIEPVTVDIALTDGIRIGSDGGDRTQAGYCATEEIDLTNIPKPCTIQLTKAKWLVFDGESNTMIRVHSEKADGTTLINDITKESVGGNYFSIVNNSDNGSDVTVTVTSNDVGYIRFSGQWSYGGASDSNNSFAAANTKATLTYTPIA